MAKKLSSDNWGKSFLMVCRYRWLVRLLLRNSTLTWPDIASRWEESPEVQADGELSRRTFDNMVKMLRKCGVRIYCERCSGHYKCEVESASNIEDDNYADIMRELILGEQVRQNNSDIYAHIIGEEIPSKGRFFDIIAERLENHQTITLRYKSFRDDNELEYTVEPYALKLFKRRWYLFANQKTEAEQNPELEDKPMGMATLALDRITYVGEANADKFNYPANYDAKKYFEDYFGVITYEKNKGMIQPVDILLKVYTRANKHKYIATLPLHTSQKVVEDSCQDYWIFSYRLAPTYDFVQELLMHREDIEVLEPASLRKDMAKALYATSRYYINEIKEWSNHEE